ncbi:PREDICTED: uncharacterized protein LOC109588219 [Amphimedon queenslandica]|uniref:Uncharacterized protein n=1 Tax=Amphimedon queenslandica TaxID=400682 RepID=A0AAN0JT08_AMPQE|nr:PREDICTED: uncharacterized protein LOC109588219 [Amphimedon queenslandica]|eukprot:XP_019859959.1 PREDICTED: uncharacterized protein LOC109588219 [Amphimedon queenslandica]
MFPKDFIFYFNLAYTNYSNESVEKNAHLVMIRYLHELKKVPIETVAEQVEQFVKLGDFKAEMSGITNLSSVFEHTARAFSKHCELYFKVGEISELFHVTLLLISIGVKINNFSDKKLAKKYDHIWNKKFNDYYRSGFNQNDLLCLEKGLKAMTTILESTPHLMSEWKDFNFILSSKVHSFEVMKKFITQSVKYLIRSGEDVSFRIDFLQPLTDMCLVASRRKKMASHFSVDTNNVIKEGKKFLACLISLIDEQKWNGYDYYTILENWMKIIFNLIDLSEESHKSQLFQWIHEGQINSSYFDYEYSFNKEYYKSGFNQVELRCLEEGSKAMTIILEGSPHLMARWKDFYVIFSSKDHTFETMKEFITHVKYLIKSGKDGSFRIDFLQPLTDMCLNASHKKKMASHFSVDANNVIKEGKEFLTCLILLIDEQKLNGHDYSTILENWMRIIFNLINLSEQLDESQLLQWIREGQINSSYFDYEYSFNKKLEDFLLRSQNLSAESLVSILSAVSSKHFDNAKVIIHFQDNLCIQYYS